MNKFMVATKAHHKLGDISREESDLCYIDREDEGNYYGAWMTGFGFINVRFPKETTRPLTAAEVDDWASKGIQVSDHPPHMFTREELEATQ